MAAELKQKQSHQLIYLGLILFLLGLITGLIIPTLANPRMALSSHLEGVLNGMVLMITGLIWSHLVLDTRWLKIAFCLAIYGTFANWAGILFAAITDSGAMLNIAAEGKQGSPFYEGIVNFLLISLSLAMVMHFCILIVGFRSFMQSTLTQN